MKRQRLTLNEGHIWIALEDQYSVEVCLQAAPGRVAGHRDAK
jgi:hypothetical protein